MNCPVCSDTRLVISERQGVEIDYCPNCRGVWLDRGELDKIIERSNEILDRNSSIRVEDSKFSEREKYYGEKKYEDPYYKKNKKKSFLDDIFDF